MLDRVREFALGLPATSERAAPRGAHPQFMTNGKCFAETPDPDELRTWTTGGWTTVAFAEATLPEVEERLLAGWRLRARRLDVAGLDYALGRRDLSEVFAELRRWPELLERGEGDFAAAGRAFLHFHHYETSRHADVKEGLAWGEPIPFPLGVPPADVVDSFLTEVRRRLSVTIDAVQTRKTQSRATTSRNLNR